MEKLQKKVAERRAKMAAWLGKTMERHQKMAPRLAEMTQRHTKMVERPEEMANDHGKMMERHRKIVERHPKTVEWQESAKFLKALDATSSRLSLSNSFERISTPQGPV